MTKSVDPDETAHCEPSHLDLHCFQRYLYQSVGMKGLTLKFQYSPYDVMVCKQPSVYTSGFGSVIELYCPFNNILDIQGLSCVCECFSTVGCHGCSMNSLQLYNVNPCLAE